MQPVLLVDNQRYRRPLGPDVVEECNAVAALPAVDPDSWVPLFDPHDFVEAHEPLEVEQYQLPQEDMQTLGPASYQAPSERRGEGQRVRGRLILGNA